MDKIIKNTKYKGVSLFMYPVSNMQNGNIINSNFSSSFLLEAYNAERWNEIRLQRDRLISDTDWTQAVDCKLQLDKKNEFAEYRQALRDIPQIYDNPDDVVWPQKPTL